MEIRDLRAIWHERRGHIVELIAELDPAHRAAVEAIIAEADRRMGGDTSALSDKPVFRAAINRCIANVLEVTLQRFGMRGHACQGSPLWHERKEDITRLLSGVHHPTRTARRLLTSLLDYGDVAGVEILTSAHSRVWLASLNIDVRSLQVEAVRWLVADRERQGAAPIPGAAFCLAQETDESVHELAAWARMLVPTY